MDEYMLYVGCHGVDDPNRAGLVFAAARGVHRNKELAAGKVGAKIALLADAVLLMKRVIAQNTIIAGRIPNELAARFCPIVEKFPRGYH